jgi:D-alanyl-D-alanine carboxypeptidase (penicillin-binding protein 5/6)
MLDYTGIYEYDFRPEPNPFKLWSTNRLLKWYAGADGLKTGYTPEAGRCLVATAERDGMRLISVVLGVEEARGHFTESMKLLDYGFNHFEYQEFCAAGAQVTELPVEKGELEQLPLLAADTLAYVRERGSEGEAELRVETEEAVVAPVEAGAKLGEAVLLSQGTELARVDLLAASSVARCSFWRLWRQLFSAWLFA